MISLAVDLLGADTDERELCRGALAALKRKPNCSSIFADIGTRSPR